MENLLELLKKYNMTNEDIASVTGSPLITSQPVNAEMNMGVSQDMGLENQSLLGSDQKLNKTLNLMGLLGSPETLMGLSLLGAGARGESPGQALLPSFVEGLKGASLVGEFSKAQRQQEFVKNLPQGIYKTIGAAYPELAAKGMIEEEIQKPKIVAEQMKQISELNKSYRELYTKSDVVKNFQEGQTQLNKIFDAAGRKTAAGDVSLIFAYMKLLDPQSVVREGEQATAQNTTSVPGQIRNLYNRAITGQRLNEDQRKEFSNAAIGAFQSNQQALDSFRNNIATSVAPFGGSTGEIFIDADIRPKRIRVGDREVNVPTGTRLIDFDRVNKEYIYKTPDTASSKGFVFKVKQQTE